MANTLQQSITRNHKLAQQLIHLQEEERKSLARDLHDELGQSLTAISVDGTALLEMSRNEFPRARDSAQAIVDITQHVITQIRVMLQRLRPEVLDGLGLREALNEMIAAWQQRHPGVTCTVDLGNDIDSADDTANITSYRVVQECLTNISRHAEAHNVGIVVRRGIRLNMGMLEIMVSDDGKGFDVDNHQGFGLTGMRERVEGMGGGFKLASTRGSGTHIFVSIPVRESS
jgi:two-component system sensor histidine kinase UhpB